MINKHLISITINLPKNNNYLKIELINNLNNEKLEYNVLNKMESTFEIDHSDLEPHLNYSYIIYEIKNNVWSPVSNIKKIFPVSYDIENEISYSLFRNDSSDQLLIVFSSSIESNKFNYFKSLNEYHTNILYLSDENFNGDSSKCSYYIGFNGNNNYEIKTINLINQIRDILNISKEKTITFGSSKGGFAALYYTFKYSFGTAIVGSPTIYLASIHRHTRKGKSLIRHLAGEYSNDSILEINALIYNATEKCDNKPLIYYHVGNREPRYSKHAVHFLKYLDVTNAASYELDLGDYGDHSLVSEFFPSYALRVLDKIILE